MCLCVYGGWGGGGGVGLAMICQLQVKSDNRVGKESMFSLLVKITELEGGGGYLFVTTSS